MAFSILNSRDGLVRSLFLRLERRWLHPIALIAGTEVRGGRRCRNFTSASPKREKTRRQGCLPARPQIMLISILAELAEFALPALVYPKQVIQFNWPLVFASQKSIQ